MRDAVYLTDVATQTLTPVRPVSFADINVKERSDLEKWVVSFPEILGEPLLVITSEYSRFDRSSRRLDVLALDEDGVLVIIELKLDVAGSLADQQAIRYAAFCSTMTTEQVIELAADYYHISPDEAEAKILEFLSIDELPQLNDQPRIIIAAGSMEDQELTACVLWLRRFGLDISCVELTPYRLPGPSQQIVLVPRTIIPLPETIDYQIKAERKEVARVKERKTRATNEALWTAIGDVFNRMNLQFKTTGRAKQDYMTIPIGHGKIHYEWMIRKGAASLDVAVHFEDDDGERNQAMLEPFEAERAALERDLGDTLYIGRFGKKWCQVSRGALNPAIDGRFKTGQCFDALCTSSL